MSIPSFETYMKAPNKAKYVKENDPDIYGGSVSDMFFANVGRNKRNRLK